MHHRRRIVFGEVDVESLPEYQGLVGQAFLVDDDVAPNLPMSGLISPRQYHQSHLSKETTTILLSSAKKTPSSRRTSVGDSMDGLVEGLVDAPRDRKSLLRRLKVSESPLGKKRRSTSKSASKSAMGRASDVVSPTRGKSNVEVVDDLTKK
jgi:hypothetical protein